jgi:hypothetical protein
MLNMLIILLTLFLVVQITYVVIYIRKSIRISKALNNQFKNKIYCGKFVCEPDIQVLNPPTALVPVYDKSLALYCANIILAVEYSKTAPQPKDLTKIIDLFDNKSDPPIGTIWSAVMGTNKVAYIAFRGTENIQEWTQDFNYSEVPYSHKKQQVSLSIHLPAVAKSLSMLTQGTGDSQPNVLVHKGFIDAYINVKNDMMKAMLIIKPDYTVVTGHSLGSALSTLASVDIVSFGYKNVLSYNFASPRVGNQDFSSLVKALNFPFYRIVNDADIVPTLPSSVFPNFDNVEQPYIFEHCGTPVYFTVNRSSLLNNHLLGSYIQGIS